MRKIYSDANQAITQRGFSLVELSIVLVILGLLVGGVLSGQSLIRAAELRAVSSEYARFTTAVRSFRDKYFALPGDMTNATAFWGTASGGCPTGARSGTQTCNGNGNGNLYEQNEEMFLFWQHLANAALIEGSYTGFTGAGHAQYDVIGGTNVPKSKVSNGLWTARGMNLTSNASWFDTNSQLLFEVGAKQPNYWNEAVLFKPEELWNMDTKMDDGKPGTGKINAFDWAGCTTASSSADKAAAQYRLSDSSNRCVAVFLDVI